MHPAGSLRCSHQPNICPCSTLDEASQCSTILHWRSILILFSQLHLGLPSDLGLTHLLTHSLFLSQTHTHAEVPGGQDFNLSWPVLTKHDETTWLQLGFPSSAATAQITFSSVKLHPSLSELGWCRNLCSSGILHPLKMGGTGVP